MRALLPYLALFAVNCLYGANYAIAKGLMPDVIGPSGFILLRVIGAVLLFWTIYLMRPERIAKKDYLRLAGCGLFGVAINQLFFFNGLSHTSPVNSAIIMTITPIMVLIMAALLLGEKVGWRKAIGVGIGFIGAAGLIILSAQGGLQGSSVKGDLMILSNALSYSVYLIMVKPLMSRYRPLTVISWVFLFGLLYVIPFGWTQFSTVDWVGLSARSIWSMGYVVVGVTFLAYLLNVYALSRVSPSVVSAFIYLQPVLAAFFTWLFVSMGTYDLPAPRFTGPMILATTAIFVGVALVSWRKRAK